MTHRRKCLMFLLLWICSTVLAAAFALPPILMVIWLLFCLWLHWKKKLGEWTTLLITLSLFLAVTELVVRYNADRIFYREHERWALKTRYRTNIDASLESRFGDLVAMDPSLRPRIAQPHHIHFHTDAQGVRNDHPYRDAAYLLLGDSFVASVGNSQEDILVSQLNAARPHLFYSLGFPGAPKEYETRASLFLERHPSDARLLWFIFEGNDFLLPGETAEAPKAPAWSDRWKDYRTIHLLPLLTTRLLTLLQKSLKADHDKPSEVRIWTIAGQDVGFFEPYVKHSTALALEFHLLGQPEILKRTACVFFIPDKYRLYKPWIPDGAAVSEPAAGLQALQRYFGPHNIPVHDLTPAMQGHAAEALKRGSFLFWRDDTHWNKEGIASALPEILSCLEKDRRTTESTPPL